jgi:hypothetical protein
MATITAFSIISLKSNWLHWHHFLLVFVAATWPCISAPAAGFVAVGVEVGKFV